MLTFRGVLLAALSAGALACRPSTPPQPLRSAEATRFPDPDSLVVLTDSAKWPLPLNWPKVLPRYPAGARSRGEEARIVTAFVIDTSGAVELPSITLLTPANREFDTAVCTYLARVRFALPTAARRALLVWPFEFGLGSPHPMPPDVDRLELARMLDALPRAEMAARLTAERHCD